MDKFYIAILKSLGVKHTASFVRKMSIDNIQGNNLFGVTRLLSVFGVKSSAVRLDTSDDFKDLDLPYLAVIDKDRQVLVTGQSEEGPEFTDGRKAEKSDWTSFAERADLLAVMFDAEDNAAEPGYKEHKTQEVYGNLLWAVPVVWLVWLAAMQFLNIPVMDAGLPGAAFRITGIVLSAVGLFLSVLLHREWTGDGNAVEKVCSHFKTSKCSSAHDTFFFNKWFDLSEVGASYFLSIMLVILVSPYKAWSVAWMILPALPASLWNVGYQFLKQKHWCPICLGVQALFWIIALAFMLCGAYGSLATFNPFDIIGSLLLWGTLLVLIIKAVTPAVKNRHGAESASAALSGIKGDKNVMKAILGEPASGMHEITIAISPTCPYCKKSMKTIEGILLPTGRFTLVKKYMAIHSGDEEKIASIVGGEEALEQASWCKEHGVNATPTIYLDGKKLESPYSVGDLLYF